MLSNLNEKISEPKGRTFCWYCKVDNSCHLHGPQAEPVVHYAADRARSPLAIVTLHMSLSGLTPEPVRACAHERPSTPCGGPQRRHCPSRWHTGRSGPEFCCRRPSSKT
jgi:hypothetical protein